MLYLTSYNYCNRILGHYSFVVPDHRNGQPFERGACQRNGETVNVGLHYSMKYAWQQAGMFPIDGRVLKCTCHVVVVVIVRVTLLLSAVE